MGSAELLLVASLFGGVTGVAYLLGRRRGAASVPSPPPVSEPRPAAKKDEPRAAAKAEAEEAAVEANAETNAKSEPPPSATAAAKAETKVEPEDEKKPPKNEKKDAAKPEADDEVPRLMDDDDDEDFTRVGSTKGPRTLYQPPLLPITYDEGADVEEPTNATSLFLVHATAQTDTGLRRDRNEDSLLVLPAKNLFVVADGMGGYRGGELASQLAVKSLETAYTTGEFEGPPHKDFPREASELARAIQMANASIQELAAQRPDLEGMGTTICAARFSPTKSRLFIGHVGDSRCYRLRSDVFKLMTADHTMADYGITGPESAHLSRAVGIWPTVPIDIVYATPQVGDVYLLCSDGLTKMLSEEMIANVLRGEEDPKLAVDRLIFFANSRGGKDNITVVLVRVVTANWKPRPSQTNEADLPPA